MANPILYLDYDGILHPADVRVARDEPLRPRVYVMGRATDEPLFRYASLLELLLAPYPQLEIVLSTSWVQALGYDFAVKQLPQALRERVIGATAGTVSTRYESIAEDAERRGLTRWIALDDDRDGWPEVLRDLLVAPTNPVLGLGEPGIAGELSEMLDALCTGRPLRLKTKTDNVQSTIDRLLAIPGVTNSQVVDALEENARVAEILRQVRTGRVAK